MEKKVKIATGRSLASAIETIMRESLKTSLYQNAVEEKEKQQMMIDEEDDDLDTDSSENKTSKTSDTEQEKLKKGDITVDDVVEKLNTIRSGKSFKDEAISSKLSEYIESLTKPEKVALLAFLKGLAQIVTGEIPASSAIDPRSKPADVEMKKGDEKQTKSIKPNVIKAPEKEKKEKKPTEEDTSGPVPITPKKGK